MVVLKTGPVVVSVIIPTYNRAALLTEAISSVLGQTFADLELIMVDDGSTDQTSQVIQKFLEDPRVSYLRQPNQGRSVARNVGISSAKGKFIAFLDSDDVFLPDKLKIQIETFAEHPEAGMVYSWVNGMDEKGKVLPNSNLIRGELEGNIYPDLLFIRNNLITTPGVMIRKDVLSETGLFDPTLSMCEDLDLWRRIARRYPVLLVKQPLSLVRFRMQEKPDFSNLIAARKKYYEKSIAEDASLEIIARQLYSEMYAHYGLDALFRGNIRMGLGLIKLSLTGNIFDDFGLLFGLIRAPLAMLIKKYISPERYNKIRIFYNNRVRQKVRDKL